jgi:ribonuclease BN (tRNA processing enzyme)
MKRICLFGVLGLILSASPSIAQSCIGEPIALQVLGSGGPIPNKFRTSTSYLLWVGDKAKVLVDMGGGALARFGQSEAKLADLHLIAISHLHPDHVSDLPALLWLSDRARKEPLPIVGPSGNYMAPDISTFLNRLFDAKTGAFQVLGSTLGGERGPLGTGGGVRVLPEVIDVTSPAASKVFDHDGMTITALGIPHGDMPTLAFRVQARDVSIVLSSDQNGTDPKFIEFAKGANVLIMHLAIPTGVTNPLHAAPEIVGRIARDASVGRLIVSHIGMFNLENAIADLKKVYSGPLTIGAEMLCTQVR